jgi:3-hydroxyacyl-CoA dehydrogenase
MENKWLGSKTGQGFIKKVGKDILTLDLDTLEYRLTSFATLEMTKSIDKPIDRFKVLVKEKIKQVNFTERVLLECSLTFLTEFRNIR